MDRARNLEALAEEDDEEEIGDKNSTDTSDSEDDEPDQGTKRGEPNKFDIMCDGVVNAMALVHDTVQGFLDMKDELVKHSLPPTLLIAFATTASKVFRSISDLNMPVNELVRLVRVYSTPWEEKSAALKKLHEDYEAKQRQLNIAIKRLQLVDAHSKRIAKEKRVMNWEKLFAKMMSNKGHGRRWKFLIETIKEKAKLGLEHVQEYTRALEQSTDEEEPEEEDEMSIQMKKDTEEFMDLSSDRQSEVDADDGLEGKTIGSDKEGGSDAGSEKRAPSIAIEMNDSSDGEADDEEEEEVLSRPGTDSPSKRVRFASSQENETVKEVYVKPPMQDASVWTHEPEYSRFLHVRVFTPQGMEQRNLKCMVTYGEQVFKTALLDPVDKEKADEKEKKSSSKAGGRGLIGSRGKSTTDTPPAEADSEPPRKSRFEEFVFELPEDIPEGVWRKEPEAEPANFQISVHHGQFEEMVAMATIDIEDLKDLDIPIIIEPPPKGDDDVPKSPQPGNQGINGSEVDSLSDDMDIQILDEEETEKEADKPKEDPVKDMDPLPFPLYSLQAGKGESVHKPLGTLPLKMYIGKKLRPPKYNRQSGTHGVNELVFEMTGIDLQTTSKEDLFKESREVALSALSFTPEPVYEPLHKEAKEPQEITDMVSKQEYDKLMEKHNEELQYLQAEYEKRLQEMIDNLQEMQQLQQQQQQKRPVSTESRKSGDGKSRRSPAGSAPSRRSPLLVLTPANSSDRVSIPQVPVPSVHEESRPGTVPQTYGPAPPHGQRHRKNFRVGRPLPRWGEGLPQDFFERLRQFQEESDRHKQELSEKTLREIREDIERKLAGQHKLSKKEEEMYDALKDVSIPALFMPNKTGTVFNPRAYQYFHAAGSSDLRLSQPPSMIHLPPIPKSKISVVNLFELSRNFRNQASDWLMEKYIKQQEPVGNVAGRMPQTPAPTGNSPHCGPDTSVQSIQGTSLPDQEVEA